MASKTDNIPIAEPLSSLHISDDKENKQILNSANGGGGEATEKVKNQSEKMVVTQEDDCSYDDNEIESFVDDDDDDEEDNQDEHQRHQLEVRYNELSTIKKCLLALKNVDGYRELFPFQYKLNQFVAEDKIQSNPKTKVLLNECVDIMHEIVKTLEEKGVKNTDQIDGGGFTNVDDEVEIKRNRYHEFQEADYDLDSEAYGSESEPEGNDYY
ncbi:predicted protein [Candida tropicalis MYA-3404]|uniref:Uncharacterized protein n=1 Tax=Candida tropicalis (strain ATCC MYA-3404 / T1) TaxID=294747 RepID=C5MBD3_CANTT|nr:predicted protein [Candida tropicalis MYA-3404]EER32950.1 predicted protein [Candida tropicalis MYA-3404]KAG4406777.1 hypothetical protein JTP64_004161 [Candida tropicalis]MCP8720218.1 hypothetical protein [Asgard group archaeon]